MLASCKLLKISLKGKESVPLNRQKNLSLRQTGCRSCSIVLSHHRFGQRHSHIPPKHYFVLYQSGKDLTVMLNQNITLKRGAVEKRCNIRVRTVIACTSEGGSMVAKQISGAKHTKKTGFWRLKFLLHEKSETE